MKRFKQLILFLMLVVAACFVGCDKKESKSPDKAIVLAGPRDPGRGVKDPYFTNVNLYVWEPLIGESDKGDLVPVLATSWEAKEDGKRWIFELRKNVKFSDGVDFNADAVIENFKRYESLGLAKSTFFSFNIKNSYPGLLAVNKLDDYKVELVFENPLPTLPYTIINFGSHMVSPECYNKENGEYKKFVIGTGPFVIKEHKPNEYLALERNENYYGDKAKAKYITIKMIPDHDTRVMSLRAGEIMGVYDNNAIKPLAALELEKEGNFNISSTLSANLHYINVNHRNDFLKNKDVRQAISMAVDRNKLLNDIYGGFGKVTNNILTPFSVFHKEHDIVYDVEKAKEIIKSYGDKVPKELKLITIDTYKTDAELVASWLKDIGLNIKIEVMDYKLVLEKLKAGDYDLQMTFKGMNNADASVMFDAYVYSKGYMNVDYGTFYNNPEADKLIEKMNKTFAMDERKEVYNAIQDFFVEDLPVIPLFGVGNTVVSRDEIKGYNAKWTGVTLTETEWK